MKEGFHCAQLPFPTLGVWTGNLMKANERPLDFGPWCINENRYFDLFHIISIFSHHEGTSRPSKVHRLVAGGQLWSYLNTLCHDEWKSCKLLVMCIGFQASGGAGFAGDALRSPWGGLRRRQWDDGAPRAVQTRAGQGYIGIGFWLQWIFVSGRADVHGDLAAQRRYTVYYTNLYYLVCWEMLGPRMGRGTCINKPV